MLLFGIVTYTNCGNNQKTDLQDVRACIASGAYYEARTASHNLTRDYPGNAVLHYTIGALWLQQRRYAEAIPYFEHALELDSTYELARISFAKACIKIGDYARAKKHLVPLIQQGPQLAHKYALACANLGLSVGLIDESVSLLEVLYASSKNSHAMLYDLAYGYGVAGRHQEAITMLEKFLHENPASDDNQFALGHLYLAKGDFVRGWPQHDIFLRRTERYSPCITTWINQKKLRGKKILICPEGGLGDMFQWIRCAIDLRAMGATIVVAPQPALLPLLRLCPYIDILVDTREQQESSCHAKVSVMSLPVILRMQESSMGRHVPYLYADEALVKQWQQRLLSDTNYKVGLCWHADLLNDKDRPLISHRSIDPALLQPLVNNQYVTFYSLHACAEQDPATEKLRAMGIQVFTEDFDNSHGAFMDTAALIANMDLVISVDTCLAHLAGGMGKPVWMLLPFHADWRWIYGRRDSPWYPTMSIFKQREPLCWEYVINEVCTALHENIVLEHYT